MSPSSLMNSAVIYGTQSPVSPNESSRLLNSSSTLGVKGKGKAHSHQEVDLEAQFDGASHSHEHHTRRHHRHGIRYDEVLIPGELDDERELLAAEAGLVSLQSDSRYLIHSLSSVYNLIINPNLTQQAFA